MRASQALDVIGLLEQKGAVVSYHDPYIPHFRHEGWEKDRVSDQLAAVQSSDCVVIITDHSSYSYDEILANAALIVDTRNALGDIGRDHPKVFRL